jgi:hypothetical protein
MILCDPYPAGCSHPFSAQFLLLPFKRRVSLLELFISANQRDDRDAEVKHSVSVFQYRNRDKSQSDDDGSQACAFS